uniref:Uncharacterized protein n=1 Tax=Candidatus Kentrum sp. TC TaxID=2126339 RepID=A0A450YJF7_9GAMM|nr:MAG: hypothetical protein BECKTC1821E_GA0114239_10134 [Candidatus Kentron sp. TC]
MRETSCVASRECPPRSKKLSWRPMLSRFNTAAHRLANSSSVGVAGATNSRAEKSDASGAGRAFRSILPLGVRGRDSTNTKTEGTIQSGSIPRRCVRNASRRGDS